MTAHLQFSDHGVHVTGKSISDGYGTGTNCNYLGAESPQETGHALGCAKERAQAPQQPQPAGYVRKHARYLLPQASYTVSKLSCSMAGKSSIQMTDCSRSEQGSSNHGHDGCFRNNYKCKWWVYLSQGGAGLLEHRHGKHIAETILDGGLIFLAYMGSCLFKSSAGLLEHRHNGCSMRK